MQTHTPKKGKTSSLGSTQAVGKEVRKSAFIILTLALALLVCAGVGVADVCDDTKANLTAGYKSVLNMSCDLTSGIYRVKASSTTGAILIANGNITLNCNGASIIGNQTGIGVYASSTKLNVTINNCKILNYSDSIQAWQAIEWNITNSVFSDNVVDGILIRDAKNISIVNNIFNSTSTTATTHAIKFYGLGGSNNRVANNKIDSYKYAISVQNISDTIVEYNNVSNQGLWSINAIYKSNNTIIRFNRVTGSGWNGIVFGSGGLSVPAEMYPYNILIYSNYIEDFIHHGIDSHSDINQTQAYNVSIYANTIYGLGNGTMDGGIYLSGVANSFIYSNIVKYINDTSNSLGYGITVEDGNYSYGNFVYLNNISDVSGYCVRDGANNTNYFSNTLSSCGKGQKAVYSLSYKGFPINYVNFTDDTGTSFRYNISSSSVSMRVNETTTSSSFEFYNGGLVNLNYSDRKDLTVSNNTVILNPQSFNYSIFNSTSGKAVANNVPGFTLNVSAGESYSVSKSSASGGCDYLNDNYTANINTKFCSGTYTCIDVNTDGCIKIGAANIILDGNNATLVGNGTGWGIYSNSNNVTIKNFNSTNYARNINLNSGADNNNISYNIVEDSTFGIILDSTSVNCTISNNRVNNASIYVAGSPDNLTIDNNIMDGQCIAYSGCTGYCMRIFTVTNINVTNNYCTRTRYGINLGSGNVERQINNMVFENNIIEYNDIGMYILRVAANNLTIRSNIFRNNTANYDTYDLGLQLVNSTGINISNNNFTSIFKAGIFIQNSSNLIIRNNFFDYLSLTQKADNRGFDSGGHDKGDIPCAIRIAEEFQGYTYGFSGYSSTFINISGNTFDSDTICKLLLQNTANVIEDIDNYWFKPVRFDVAISSTNKLSTYNYYFSNSFTNIQNYQGSKGIISNLYLIDGSNEATRKFNYTISITSQYYKNVNLTTTYNLSLFNLTSNPQGYAYADVFNGTNPQPQCINVNDCNVSMGAGNRTLVFQYLTAGEPRYTRVAATVDTLTVINKKTDYLAYNCTGSGYIIINGLTSFFGGKSYRVYHNGAYVESSNSDTYINDGTCSGWEFTRLENIYEADVTLDNGSSAMANLIKVLGLIAGIYAAYFIINALLKREFDYEEFKWITFTIIIIGIAFAVMLMIVSEF